MSLISDIGLILVAPSERVTGSVAMGSVATGAAAGAAAAERIN